MSQEGTEIDHIQALLTKANINADIIAVDECAGGGNNRTYQLKTTKGDFAVKKYFKAIEDKRDRLLSEYSFLSYAMQTAPNYVPRAYAKDTSTGYALYEFVKGESFKPNTLSEYDVQQAINFFCLINDPAQRQQAGHLPLASEAGFSIEDHVTSVGSRLRELTTAIDESNNNQAKDLINCINQRWQLFNSSKLSKLSQIEFKKALEKDERCISPSDFGFHNALKVHSGQFDHSYSVRFIDFEYAGWDDPARMLNDFFSQLAVPVPERFYAHFLQKVLSIFPDPKMLEMRAKILREVYQIKWCCIALNVFMPAHLARRKFANPDLDISMLHQAQIAKAELILNTMEAV